MRFPAVVLAAVLSFPVPALAENPNGAAIVKACDGSSSDGSCNSYVNGVMAGVTIDQVARDGGTPICFPPHMTTEQVRQVITKFLRARPSTWTVDGNAGVGLALIDAFPCKKQN